MVQTIALPEAVYEELKLVSEELTKMAKKPISLSMAISLMAAVYRAYLNDPCARDAFRQRLATADIVSPEDFEEACEHGIADQELKGDKNQ